MKLLRLALLAAMFAVPAQAEQRILAGHPPPKAATPTTIKFGINGHDGRYEYPLSGAEARMQWMRDNHLVSYRTDVGTSSTDILDNLVPLAKKYGVTIRPMLYPGTQQATYNLVKRYANDIKVWEIGNEQDAPKAGAQDRINAMMQSVRGVEQAEAELHAGLKTTINIMSCNNDAADSQCAGDPNGDVWFLDMARASGWQFNYISFHYYPRQHEPGYWMDKYFKQMRTAAEKYRVPIFFNETNCGEIYDGNTDGAGACQTSLSQNLAEVVANYADIVEEVNGYEMLDEKASIAGVEGHFGFLYAMGQPKPIAATLASYGAATIVTPPPQPQPTPPAYTGTVQGTFTGTVTLTPAPAK